jgi:N-acetylglucosamine-6-phosphate deacetylase
MLRDMQRPLAITGRILINRRIIEDAAIVIVDSRITEAGPRAQVDIPADAQRIDAEDQLVAPGLIDIHIHGSGGCRAEDDPVGMARHVITHGCTLFLPTLITNDLPAMLDSAALIRSLTGPVEHGATIGGIHLEGPFLNPRYGAQQARYVIEPTPQVVNQLISACGQSLRLVTMAPERAGALDAIRRFVAAGATVAIGHSDATEAEYLAAREAGITHATHIFNAMPPKAWTTAATYAGTKPVGIEELILVDDEVSADILCDCSCAHVHASLIKAALRCKQLGSLSLITDAMPAAGLPPGSYPLGDGQSVIITESEDVARLPNGLLCGSALSLAGTIRNLINIAGVSLETALVMVSEAPARAINLFHAKGSLAPGKDADLVFFNADLNVQRVIIAGRTTYATHGAIFA